MAPPPQGIISMDQHPSWMSTRPSEVVQRTGPSQAAVSSSHLRARAQRWAYSSGVISLMPVSGDQAWVVDGGTGEA